jgi:hypothetical protein
MYLNFEADLATTIQVSQFCMTQRCITQKHAVAI